MRTFIAINFDDKTKKRLAEIIDVTKMHCSRGDFTRKDNLHLTLVFLGEVEWAEINEIKEAIDAVSFKPFELKIEKIGRFRRDDGDIYWLGVEESPELLDLQRELQKELKKRGVNTDKKKFKPHLTIGRRVRGDYGRIKSIEFTMIDQTVFNIDLMISARNKGYLQYEKIY